MNDLTLAEAAQRLVDAVIDYSGDCVDGLDGDPRVSYVGVDFARLMECREDVVRAIAGEGLASGG